MQHLSGPRQVAGSAQRVVRAEQYLDQIIRGLRGEDSGLGVVSVTGQAAAASLESTTALFGDARSAIATLVGTSEPVAAVQQALRELDTASAALPERATTLAPVSSSIGISTPSMRPSGSSSTSTRSTTARWG